MSTHLVGCQGSSRDRRREERRITDRITVRALRAGVHGDDAVDAVDDLVCMAAGDPRRLARALNRLLCGESNRRVGAQARAIVLLRRALDLTSPQLLPDAVDDSDDDSDDDNDDDDECTVDAMGRSSS